ncbi:hypothetical protein UO65_5834 [Actinokineospora spheciospongiae]|uniref:Uncharacterized protein n=1 Tax=Actinokineospora spheciospongiae TaxID=909613 RepID=W7IQ22_9PSEU|nr:hypothetical protein [Actinokineospora spheciospongiae]EWC58832.1 hypothetical protein UO65_5834 [Actinokineospora spheciospongiae]PWW58270.1 hypothetical protein DFQ13_10961 [Actinokineospora spheciospongiae]
MGTGRWPDFHREHLTVAAWREPGALEGETTTMSAPLPADRVAAALERVEGMAEVGRQYGAFGAEVEVPADAPALRRALALTGRDPSWRSA